MTIKQYIRTVFAFLLFSIGLYVITTHTRNSVIEQFEDVDENMKCPDLLIQKNNLIYLYRKDDPEIPGVNPLVFENLEEYVEYAKYQRSRGIRCPVLYLQQMYSSEGKPVYRVYPSPEDVNAGLPYLQANIQVERNLIDAGYTEGNMPGYDYSGFDNGMYTPLDSMFHSPEKISDNPMDPNWGGVEYSRKVVDSEKYKDNTRKLNDREVFEHKDTVSKSLGLYDPSQKMKSDINKSNFQSFRKSNTNTSTLHIHSEL